MVFAQKWPCVQIFFFLGNIGQENVLYDILKRKNAFRGYKNKKFEKSKIEIFPKIAILQFFFIRQYRPGIRFL